MNIPNTPDVKYIETVILLARLYGRTEAKRQVRPRDDREICDLVTRWANEVLYPTPEQIGDFYDKATEQELL